MTWASWVAMGASLVNSAAIVWAGRKVRRHGRIIQQLENGGLE